MTNRPIMGEERTMEIRRANVTEAAEILALQKLAYLSGARLYNDYAIPPLTQTIGSAARRAY